MSYKTFQGFPLVELLAQGGVPTVKGWNRLEGRPRTREFDETLRAEIRDALWMLTRQWQLGEFVANDAGSPVFAKVQVAGTRIHRYQAKQPNPQPYDEAIPLEARVERQPLPLNLALSLQIGRYWLRLLAQAHQSGDLSRDYRQDFKNAYPFKAPARDSQSGGIYAHQEVWQIFAATAGRSMDGGALYQKIAVGADILAGIQTDANDAPKIYQLEKELLAWFQRQYTQPAGDEDSAWAPSYLEYQFACAAPDFDGKGEIILIADAYHQGHLDWYSFDIQPDTERDQRFKGGLQPALKPPQKQTFTFIPAVIEFGGMPNVRWWEFEDRKTSFGDIDAHTTDLAKLLLIEFGLIYANDWFLLPLELPVGSLARVEGLAVTNVFGERVWIEPAGTGQQDDWHRWSMYNLNVRGALVPADRSIFLPPVVDRLQESPPAEQVKFIRDEMANMVWGIESWVPLASGSTRDGYETATEFVNYLKSFLPPAPDQAPEVNSEAKIRYVLMTDVPENWIPFIPVRLPANDLNNREIQLQRARMLRTLPGSQDQPILPRTDLLRYNLEGTYFVHEEEVPRAGAHLSATFQRARWHQGKVCVWLGRRKRTGRGEGSSGLAFDQIKGVSE
jgi:hypothetical protein